MVSNMASRGTTNIQKRGQKFQLRITHPEMPRARFFTFDDLGAAEAYKQTTDGWFAAGVVPPELLTRDEKGITPLVIEAIRVYERSTNPAPAPSERELFRVLVDETKGLRIADITFQWATDYVQRLKSKKLAPGTIRKRVGLLARVLDHHFRSKHTAGGTMPANVLRMLPKGYAIYQDGSKTDESRDKRMSPEDDARVLAVLAGEQRTDRERPWGNVKQGEVPDPAFRILYMLIVDTGMRLKEGYVARVGDLDVKGRFLRVRGSKGHRGVIKWRTVPLIKSLYETLVAWCKGRGDDELMFPFWNGENTDLKNCSMRLSSRFSTLFEYAMVPGFTEHDLRHEACCRWVTMKDKAGRWMFTDGEICRIMGWSDPKLLLRYMSLRGEDLSARLH